MSELKQNAKDSIKRIVIICVAATLMATNIKTFVRTGDLFPGGATGLTILITNFAHSLQEVSAADIVGGDQ